MIRTLGTLILLVSAPLLAVAEPQSTPIIKTELDTTSTVPGQPVVLQVTLLVPTWMPKPPALPSFDLPNLMVLYPERATLPISTRINRKRWSGISRTYHLYPMAEGDFHLPAQAVLITYADPNTRAPVVFEGRTEAMTINARIPSAARDLDPFVAATGLRLTETIEGDLSNLSAGDAITRQLRVEIEGAAAVMIPPLLTQQALRGLSSYQRDPRLIDASERSAQSGVRVEEATYVVEAGGQFALPAAQLRWFNVRTGTIEIARVESVEITAQGPPLSLAKELDYWGESVVRSVLMLLAFAIVLMGIWRLGPKAMTFYRRQRAAYFASEFYAFWYAKHLLKQHQFGSALTASDHWWQSFGAGSRRLPVGLENAFITLGAKLYGRETKDAVPGDEQWSVTRQALQESRRARREAHHKVSDSVLPSLNPTSSHLPNREAR